MTSARGQATQVRAHGEHHEHEASVQRPIRIALVGIGKIARGQHIPVLSKDPRFTLAAAVSRHGPVDGIETFNDLDALIASKRAIDAVSFCTPALGRHAFARVALQAGLHVMLEKPPGATLGEVLDLEARARDAGLTLFASWHSREAAAVEPARQWLERRAIKSVRATWKEDVCKWHPGQDWIFEAGGFGVFDPGINCLSILTRILPAPLQLQASRLWRPANRTTPIAAELVFTSADATVHAAFDFRQTGPQQWDIEIETDQGKLLLSEGGQRLCVDGHEVHAGPDREYSRLYKRFAALIAARRSDVDIIPLQHVADALLIGEWHTTVPFQF